MDKRVFNFFGVEVTCCLDSDVSGVWFNIGPMIVTAYMSKTQGLVLGYYKDQHRTACDLAISYKDSTITVQHCDKDGKLHYRKIQ